MLAYSVNCLLAYFGYLYVYDYLHTSAHLKFDAFLNERTLVQQCGCLDADGTQHNHAFPSLLFYLVVIANHGHLKAAAGMTI